MTDPDPVVFVDTETTGLDPDRHDIWEVGAIDPGGVEHHWFLPVDLGRADPVALEIGGYHQRHPFGFDSPGGVDVTSPARFAAEFARVTWGRHLAGAVISFDEERLRRLLRRHHQTPGWHYHLIDVEPLAVGYLAGMDEDGRPNLRPPWKSDQLTEALGIHVSDMDKHTALGDARWAKAIYERVMKERTAP